MRVSSFSEMESEFLETQGPARGAKQFVLSSVGHP